MFSYYIRATRYNLGQAAKFLAASWRGQRWGMFTPGFVRWQWQAHKESQGYGG